ncbi:MAG: sulfatase [Lentisphaerales bacterium]|nr:sulfatase [Lentisphaerales bacterium]
MCISCLYASAQDRPNILWLTCEDNNIKWIGCYGNPHAKTPHIDKLATEGFQYINCYANAPVCAPSRSTWITGVHALSMGTHSMRSRYEIPHQTIKYYPDLLKKAGYYVGNDGKTDYNIGGRDDNACWDTRKTDWKILKQKQPFFMVINSAKSHESRAFGDVTKSKHNPDNVRLAKYHPDIKVIRQNYAHYHDQIAKMDADIGAALKALEASGMAENTIVIYNSDHGGVLARSKRFLYNSGTHCPLVIRIPEKFKHLRPGVPGTKVKKIVSFIDMTKTWLSLCGAETPKYLQGMVFLGKVQEEREYHVSFRGRMGERCDNVRAIRNKNFLYIRNYMPYAPSGQRLTYLWKMPATLAWEKHHKEGKTDAVTGRFFKTKSMEELYDTSKDPDNVVNLIKNPEYKALVAELRQAMSDWQSKNFDAALLPESEMVKRAADNKMTIYEMVRNPELYKIDSYLATANMAIENNPSNLPNFYEELKHSDNGVRYWAMVGCLLIAEHSSVDLKVIKKYLVDECHEVRALAAWIFYKKGDKPTAQACWNDMLSKNSHASLKVLNIIDWIGDSTKPYATAIKACQFKHGGNVNRMKDYFGYSNRKSKGTKKKP